ncbi:MAG: tail fiber domain-containing protein [Ignavibacteriae bacterium]|nr:tail fiber domain-containing protein [Ignavibacteriota bacterium]
MHTFKNRSLSLLIILFLAVQINAQETQKIDKTDSLQDIYSIQASAPAIYFKNNSSNTLATINEETDGRNAKFGSLSLQKAAGSVSSAMDNKLWIDVNDNLKFGNSTLTGIWSFNGATLTLPSGYMVIGNTISEAANTTVLNVLGRAKMHSFRMADGDEGDGKVLTSDANGVGTWQTSSSGGSIDALIDGKSTVGSGNVYLGEYAGDNDNSDSGTENVGVGRNTLAAIGTNQGLRNTAVGSGSMKSFNSGNYNTAVGFEALKGGDFGPSNGDENTAIGYGALRNNTGGVGNVAIGYEAGRTSSGDDKLYIHNSNAGTSSLIYGDFSNAELDINGELTVLQGIYGTLHGDSYGTNYPSSDKRFKKDIAPLISSIENIQKLRGVTYTWRKDEFPAENFNDKKQIGLIAQEVEKVFPELVHTREDGYKGVEYSKLTAVLIEAVKEQQIKIDDLKKLNSEFSTQNSELEKRLSNLESLVKTNRFTKASN